VPVSEIRKQTCREYGSFRGVSPGTIRRELGALRAAINHDREEGRLLGTVVVTLPAMPDGKDRWLTRNEAAALIRAARKTTKARWHLPFFILLGLYTGARKEAVLSLKWSQIDLERRRIDFNPSDRERTSKGRPIIPIPRRLMTFLRLTKRRARPDDFVIYRIRKVKDETGWKKAVRAPIKDIKKSFHDAACKAELTTHYQESKKKGPTKEGWPVTWVRPITDVTPHVLRHTAASWMAQRRVSFPEIARYLGHSDSRTTERIYAHHNPDYLKGASESFD